KTSRDGACADAKTPAPRRRPIYASNIHALQWGSRSPRGSVGRNMNPYLDSVGRDASLPSRERGSKQGPYLRPSRRIRGGSLRRSVGRTIANALALALNKTAPSCGRVG